MPIYSLYSSVYLNEIEKCYRKIITINEKPQGPLATITKRIKNNKTEVVGRRSPSTNRKQMSEIYSAFFSFVVPELVHRGIFERIFSIIFRHFSLFN